MSLLFIIIIISFKLQNLFSDLNLNINSISVSIWSSTVSQPLSVSVALSVQENIPTTDVCEPHLLP